MDDSSLARFFAKVDLTLDCWLWTGCLGGQGYGWLRVADRAQPAHRLSYEHFVGPVADGLTVDHLCRVRHCVNPAHLEPVTRGENVMRGIGLAPINAAKTHCDHGHEFTPENTRITQEGWRQCRECDRARNQRSRERALAVAA